MGTSGSSIKTNVKTCTCDGIILCSYMGWGVKCLESSYTEKDLSVSVYMKLNVSQQCVPAAMKVKHILSCISRSIATVLRKASAEFL